MAVALLLRRAPVALGRLPFACNQFQMQKTMTTAPEVLFSVEDRAGVISLNKPKVLNALNQSMALAIESQLRRWLNEKEVDLVMIEGAGEKAFCAGGDIRAVTEERGSRIQREFFRDEYVLNHLIGTCPVPYIAFIHGITMGGGVGLSVHGKYRVATEKTVFAMPETAIGLFPDVGGSYFLPRLQGALGTYLALSGHRLKGLDNLRAGIATHMCPLEKLPSLKKDLIHLSDKSQSEVEKVLQSYSESFLGLQKGQEFSLDSKMDEINHCFSADTLDEVLQRLENSGEWGQKQIDNLRKMSPTSVKVTFRGMQEGSKLPDLASCLAMEYRIVQRCCEDFDFYEGVRAVLIERDNAPKWRPPTLKEATEEHVNRYFSRLPESLELKL